MTPKPIHLPLLRRRMAALNLATVATEIGRTLDGQPITVLPDGSIWIGDQFFSSPLFRAALAWRLRGREGR